MIREIYTSKDPTARVGVEIETDPHLTEVSVSILDGRDQPEIEGAALDATQVGAIVRQLTSWLAERAR